MIGRRSSPAPEPERPGPPRDVLAAVGLGTAPALLRVADVARALGVSRQTVYRLVAEGELHAVRLGPKGTRVLRESVAALLER